MSPEISNCMQFMKSDKFDNETPGSGFVASSFQSYLFLVLTFWRRILTCSGTSFYPVEEGLVCSSRQRKLRQMSEKVLSGRLRQEIADDISQKGLLLCAENCVRKNGSFQGQQKDLEVKHPIQCPFA